MSFQARSGTSASCRSRSGAPESAILALTPELATLEDLFFRLTESDGSDGVLRSGNGAGAAAAGESAVAGENVGLRSPDDERAQAR